jgi:ATP-dependent DNA helicase RecQ
MDQFDFTALRQDLADWPSRATRADVEAASPLLGRIRQILDSARSSGSFASHPDLMVLIRQLLLSRSTDGRVEHLRAPQSQGWPDADAWKRFGVQLTRTGTHFLLEPKPWQPDWLGAETKHGDDLFGPEHQANKPMRRDARVPMDPFLCKVTGFEHYVSPGQREALLSALLMPPRTSLIVNLPTGSGKTLVAQAPMLVRGQNAGLTLFVVPTNALALDLERRTRPIGKGMYWRGSAAVPMAATKRSSNAYALGLKVSCSPPPRPCAVPYCSPSTRQRKRA